MASRASYLNKEDLKKHVDTFLYKREGRKREGRRVAPSFSLASQQSPQHAPLSQQQVSLLKTQWVQGKKKNLELLHATLQRTF